MKKITFNSIVLPSSGSHLLAPRILKSYLVDKGYARYFDILLDLYFTDTDNKTIADKILKKNPSIAAFSVYSWNVLKIKEISSFLKKENQEIFIILGGPYATYAAKELMQSCPIDFIVKGPGEDVLCSVLTSLYNGQSDLSDIPNLVFKKQGRVIQTKEEYLFDVSKQTYELSVHEGEYAIFYYETSRGCPFKCRYCTWNASLGKIIYYSKEKIEKDINAIFSLPYVKYLALCDSDLFLNTKHGVWVLKLIRRLNAKRRSESMGQINLLFEINPEFLDEESMREIIYLPEGLNIISCGLQTQDELVNHLYLNRPYNKQKYKKNLARLFKMAKENNVPERVKKTITIEVIYGLPGDSLQGFKKTIEFMLSELKVTNFICFCFEVLPGSYFWEHADDYNMICEKTPPHHLVRSNDFSKQDMEDARRLVFFMYLFANMFKGIMRYVENKISNNRLEVYEKIIDMISGTYPEFVSDIYEKYHHEDENETLLKMMRRQMDKKYSNIRQNIIKQAREIIKQTQASFKTTSDE
jgi:radical SAM superfamily enzyme YgiQ (UPF0313 family)